MYHFETIEHLKEEAFHTLIMSCASVLVRSGIRPNLIDINYGDIKSPDGDPATYAAIFTRKSEEPEMDPITGKIDATLQFTIYRTSNKVVRMCVNNLEESETVIPTVDYIACFDDPRYDNKPMFEVAPVVTPTKPDDKMKFAWIVGMFTGALSAMLNLPAPPNPNETLEEIQNQLMKEEENNDDEEE